ncbi:MAG: phosphate starvation-inducible protein PhoH, partial [Deltaproteobacteria bacterium]
NDEKIGEVARDYSLKLITNDIAFKIRSLTRGVDAESMYKNAESDPSSYEFNYHFTLSADDEISSVQDRDEFKSLSDWSMIEIEQTLPDSNTLSGKKTFGIKAHGGFEEFDFDEILSQTKPYIMPINLEQKFFYSMLIHPSNFISVCTGSTGSGKTLVALQAGLYLQKQGIVDGIVYIRNTITATDKEAELGFRKGDQGQKLGFFMYPLYATINFTIEKIRKESWENAQEYTGEINAITKQEATDKFIANHNIEMMDIAHARGTTVSKKFVIFDEAQNVSNATLKLIGTRMGKDSRLVVLGDWKQIDHPYLTNERNGLVTLFSKANKTDMVAGIHLHHTIRSDVAKWFDEAFN